MRTRWNASTGVVTAALTIVGVALAGCSAVVDSSEAVGADTTTAIRLPPGTGEFDPQLGGASAPATDVSIVSRDSTETPVDGPGGVYDVCYINAFQSQPGEASAWLEAGLVLLDDDRAPVADEAWPDEFLLDPSTERQRTEIVARLTPLIDACARAGFDAVEFDNLDSWSRSGGRISRAAAYALAAELVSAAHAAGLAAAQKNAAEDSEELRDAVGFDFAVTEECVVWNECAAYTAVYGDLVFDIEYPDSGWDLAALCASADRPSRVVIRDRSLAPAGDPDHLRIPCPQLRVSGR